MPDKSAAETPIGQQTPSASTSQPAPSTPTVVPPQVDPTKQSQIEIAAMQTTIAMLSTVVAAILRVSPTDAMGSHDHILQAIEDVKDSSSDIKAGATKFVQVNLSNRRS